MAAGHLARRPLQAQTTTKHQEKQIETSNAPQKSKIAYRILALLAGIGIVAAAMIDPERAAWFPKCPIHHFTGLDCPGCGTARAIHALAHGDWKAALRYNAILFVAIPFLLGIIAQPRWARSPKVAGAVFAAVVGWTVVRNII